MVLAEESGILIIYFKVIIDPEQKVKLCNNIGCIFS